MEGIQTGYDGYAVEEEIKIDDTAVETEKGKVIGRKWLFVLAAVIVLAVITGGVAAYLGECRVEGIS